MAEEQPDVLTAPDSFDRIGRNRVRRQRRPINSGFLSPTVVLLYVSISMNTWLYVFVLAVVELVQVSDESRLNVVPLYPSHA